MALCIAIKNAVRLTLERELTNVEIHKIDQYCKTIKITSNMSLNLALTYHVKRVVAVLNVQTKLQNYSDSVQTKLQNYSDSVQTKLQNYSDSVQTKLQNYSDIQQSMIFDNYQPMQLTHITHPLPDEKAVISKEDQIGTELEVLYLMDTADTLIKNVFPQIKTKYNYLLLDSNNCYEISNERTTFTWLLNEENPRNTIGYINLHSILRNITMARLGRVAFCHMHQNEIDIFNSKRRVAFGFEEFASQALITPSGVKFQFLGNKRNSEILTGSNFYISSYEQNRGWFRFREPYKILNTLTLNIWDLFGPMEQRISMPDSYLTFTGIQTYDFSVDLGSGNEILNPLLIPDYALYMDIQYNDYPYINYEYYSGVSREPVIISGFQTLPIGVDVDPDTGEFFPIYDQPIMDAYNGQHVINIVGKFSQILNPPINQPDIDESLLSVCEPPAPLGTNLSTNPALWPRFNIRVLYKPRFTGVLELASQDDYDIDEYTVDE